MPPDRLVSGSLLVAGLMLVGGPAAADPTPQEVIEQSLMCYCGCADLTVRVCTCGTAASMRQEITTRLSGGASVEEVLAGFVSRHGEQILSAPTKKGFNLLAWVMPFAVLLVAAAALIVVIRRWEAVGSADAAAGRTAPAADLSEAQRLALERVEREMREHH